MPFKNNMTMMFAMHDALRRELGRIARVTEQSGDDPKLILRAAAGWAMFKSYLEVHHGAEDDILWPHMRLTLGKGSEGWELLDAMEAEHARIDPLLAAIDDAVSDLRTGPGRLGALTDALNSSLRAHLDHEEADGLKLIDATVTPEVWQAFRTEHGKRIGADAPRYFPWLLDGASPTTVSAALAQLPPPVQNAYQSEWLPAYTKLTLWPTAPIREATD